ncbi:MAG: alpha/beta fold hydrolase, partial [Candidatus Omnitrophota bacterium]
YLFGLIANQIEADADNPIYRELAQAGEESVASPLDRSFGSLDETVSAIRNRINSVTAETTTLVLINETFPMEDSFLLKKLIAQLEAEGKLVAAKSQIGFLACDAGDICSDLASEVYSAMQEGINIILFEGQNIHNLFDKTKLMLPDIHVVEVKIEVKIKGKKRWTRYLVSNFSSQNIFNPVLSVIAQRNDLNFARVFLSTLIMETDKALKNNDSTFLKSVIGLCKDDLSSEVLEGLGNQLLEIIQGVIKNPGRKLVTISDRTGTVSASPLEELPEYARLQFFKDLKTLAEGKENALVSDRAGLYYDYLLNRAKSRLKEYIRKKHNLLYVDDPLVEHLSVGEQEDETINEVILDIHAAFGKNKLEYFDLLSSEMKKMKVEGKGEARHLIEIGYIAVIPVNIRRGENISEQFIFLAATLKGLVEMARVNAFSYNFMLDQADLYELLIDYRKDAGIFIYEPRNERAREAIEKEHSRLEEKLLCAFYINRIYKLNLPAKEGFTPIKIIRDWNLVSKELEKILSEGNDSVNYVDTFDFPILAEKRLSITGEDGALEKAKHGLLEAAIVDFSGKSEAVFLDSEYGLIEGLGLIILKEKVMAYLADSSNPDKKAEASRFLRTLKERILERILYVMYSEFSDSIEMPGYEIITDREPILNLLKLKASQEEKRVKYFDILNLRYKEMPILKEREEEEAVEKVLQGKLEAAVINIRLPGQVVISDGINAYPGHLEGLYVILMDTEPALMERMRQENKETTASPIETETSLPEAQDAALVEELMRINLELFVLLEKRKQELNSDEREKITREMKDKVIALVQFLDSLKVDTEYREKARESLRKAFDLIVGQNEPAANACLMGAINAIAKERQDEFKKRLEDLRGVSRVWAKARYIYMLQQRYVSKNGLEKKVLEYRKVRFELLWQALRSLDEQIDTELKERQWLISVSRIIAEGCLDTSELAKIYKSLSNSRIKVEQKRLAALALGDAIKLIKLGNKEQAGELLDIVLRLLDSRIQETEAIIANLTKGYVQELRQIVTQRNEAVRRIANAALEDLINNRIGEAKEKINILTGLQVLREPVYAGMIILLKLTLNGLNEGRNDEKAKYNLRLLITKSEEADTLSRFMTKFRAAYVDSILYKGAEFSQEQKERVFLETFSQFVGEGNLIRGSPEKAWTLCYLAAFVSMKAPRPDKPSKKEDNRVFKAATTLIIIQEVRDFERIVKDLARRKRTLICDLLTYLRKTGGIDYSILSASEKERVAAALIIDYGLKENEAAEFLRLSERKNFQPGSSPVSPKTEKSHSLGRLIEAIRNNKVYIRSFAALGTILLIVIFLLTDQLWIKALVATKFLLVIAGAITAVVVKYLIHKGRESKVKLSNVTNVPTEDIDSWHIAEEWEFIRLKMELDYRISILRDYPKDKNTRFCAQKLSGRLKRHAIAELQRNHKIMAQGKLKVKRLYINTMREMLMFVNSGIHSLRFIDVADLPFTMTDNNLVTRQIILLDKEGALDPEILKNIEDGLFNAGGVYLFLPKEVDEDSKGAGNIDEFFKLAKDPARRVLADFFLFPTVKRLTENSGKGSSPISIHQQAQFGMNKTTSSPVRQLKNFMVAVNLLDVGAEIVDGKVTYRNSLKKARELLPIFADSGVGKIYLYGIYHISKISRELHHVETADRHFITHNNATITTNGYKTKRQKVAGFELMDFNGNPFSIYSMFIFNPRLSDSDTENDLREFIEEAHRLGLKIVVDFIPWLSPDAIDCRNYKKTFYRELTDKEREDYETLSNEKKEVFIKTLLISDGTFCAVKIAEEGKERIIFVKHLMGDYGAHADQVPLNIFLPEVQAYYLDSLKRMVDFGVDEVRVDLAHKLLKRNMAFYFNSTSRADWNACSLHNEPIKKIISEVKKYASENNKLFEFNMETYNDEDRAELLGLGADRTYYINIFQDYCKPVWWGQTARFLRCSVEYALNMKSKLLVFPSNFDELPLKAIGGPQKGFATLLITLAHLGVVVMVDMREWLSQLGQLIPIAGGADKHYFPSEEELLRRVNFEGLKQEFKNNRIWEVALRNFLELFPKEEAGGIFIQFLDNSNLDQFVTFAWKSESSEWNLIIFNAKPKQEAESMWVELPPQLVKTKFEQLVATEATTLERYPIYSISSHVGEFHRIGPVVFKGNEECKIISIRMSSSSVGNITAAMAISLAINPVSAEQVWSGVSLPTAFKTPPIQDRLDLSEQNRKVTPAQRIDQYGTYTKEGRYGTICSSPAAESQKVNELQDVITLFNTKNGASFELRGYKGWKGYYEVWIDNRLIKDSWICIEETDNTVKISQFYLGLNEYAEGYKYTSQGLGQAILEYLVSYGRNRGKRLLTITHTHNYGLMRMCYKYINKQTKYGFEDSSKEENKEAYFQDVDWLRDFGSFDIFVSEIGQATFRLGEDNKTICEPGSVKPDAKEDFFRDIRVTNESGRIYVRFTDGRENQGIYYQVGIPEPVDICIPIPAVSSPFDKGFFAFLIISLGLPVLALPSVAGGKLAFSRLAGATFIMLYTGALQQSLLQGKTPVVLVPRYNNIKKVFGRLIMAVVFSVLVLLLPINASLRAEEIKKEDTVSKPANTGVEFNIKEGDRYYGMIAGKLANNPDNSRGVSKEHFNRAYEHYQEAYTYYYSRGETGAVVDMVQARRKQVFEMLQNYKKGKTYWLYVLMSFEEITARVVQIKKDLNWDIPVVTEKRELEHPYSLIQISKKESAGIKIIKIVEDKDKGTVYIKGLSERRHYDVEYFELGKKEIKSYSENNVPLEIKALFSASSSPATPVPPGRKDSKGPTSLKELMAQLTSQQQRLLYAAAIFELEHHGSAQIILTDDKKFKKATKERKLHAFDVLLFMGHGVEFMESLLRKLSWSYTDYYIAGGDLIKDLKYLFDNWYSKLPESQRAKFLKQASEYIEKYPLPVIEEAEKTSWVGRIFKRGGSDKAGSPVVDSPLLFGALVAVSSSQTKEEFPFGQGNNPSRKLLPLALPSQVNNGDGSILTGSVFLGFPSKIEPSPALPAVGIVTWGALILTSTFGTQLNGWVGRRPAAVICVVAGRLPYIGAQEVKILMLSDGSASPIGRLTPAAQELFNVIDSNDRLRMIFGLYPDTGELSGLKEHVFFTALHFKIFAEKMGLPSEEIDEGLLACLGHDIGKTEPEIKELIIKPARYSPCGDEMKVISRHPQESVRILEEHNLGLSNKSKDFIRLHHADLRDIIDPQIYRPLLCIIAADIYTAITLKTKDRNYRQAGSIYEGFRVICEHVEKEWETLGIERERDYAEEEYIKSRVDRIAKAYAAIILALTYIKAQEVTAAYVENLKVVPQKVEEAINEQGNPNPDFIQALSERVNNLIVLIEEAFNSLSKINIFLKDNQELEKFIDLSERATQATGFIGCALGFDIMSNGCGNYPAGVFFGSLEEVFKTRIHNLAELQKARSLALKVTKYLEGENKQNFEELMKEIQKIFEKEYDNVLLRLVVECNVAINGATDYREAEKIARSIYDKYGTDNLHGRQGAPWVELKQLLFVGQQEAGSPVTSYNNRDGSILGMEHKKKIEPSLLFIDWGNLRLFVAQDHESLSRTAAKFWAQEMIKANNAKGSVVVAFFAGKTPKPIYEAMRRKYGNTLRRLKIIGMDIDEWTGAAPCDPSSFNRELMQEVAEPLKIKEVYFFNGAAKDMLKEGKRIQAAIDHYGGIDLLLAGVGTNDHVGLCEPGCDLDAGIHIENLTEKTKTVNKVSYDQGATMGPATMLESKMLILHFSGKTKAGPFARFYFSEVSNDIPVTIVKSHRNAVVFVDKDALAGLDYISLFARNHWDKVKAAKELGVSCEELGQELKAMNLDINWFKRWTVLKFLEKNDYSIKMTARDLGIGRTTLRDWIRELHIDTFGLEREYIIDLLRHRGFQINRAQKGYIGDLTGRMQKLGVDIKVEERRWLIGELNRCNWDVAQVARHSYYSKADLEKLIEEYGLVNKTEYYEEKEGRRAYLISLLGKNNWVLENTAREAGLTQSKLQKEMNNYHLSEPKAGPYGSWEEIRWYRNQAARVLKTKDISDLDIPARIRPLVYQIIDQFDPRMCTIKYHTLRMVSLALKLAEKMGLSPEEKEILIISILIHDLGKQNQGLAHLNDGSFATIADKIGCPEILNIEERMLADRHPFYSLAILDRAGIKISEDPVREFIIRSVVMNHHKDGYLINGLNMEGLNLPPEQLVEVVRTIQRLALMLSMLDKMDASQDLTRCSYRYTGIADLDTVVKGIIAEKSQGKDIFASLMNRFADIYNQGGREDIAKICSETYPLGIMPNPYLISRESQKSPPEIHMPSVIFRHGEMTPEAEGAIRDYVEQSFIRALSPNSSMHLDHMNNMAKIFSFFAPSIQSMCGPVDENTLKATALLHDIGKTVNKGGGFRRTLAAHHIEGADMAKRILKDMGYYGYFIKRVKENILRHTAPVVEDEWTGRYGFMRRHIEKVNQEFNCVIPILPAITAEQRFTRAADMLDLMGEGIPKVVTSRQTPGWFEEESLLESLLSIRQSVREARLEILNQGMPPVFISIANELYCRSIRFIHQAIPQTTEHKIKTVGGLRAFYDRFVTDNPVYYDSIIADKSGSPLISAAPALLNRVAQKAYISAAKFGWDESVCYTLSSLSEAFRKEIVESYIGQGKDVLTLGGGRMELEEEIFKNGNVVLSVDIIPEFVFWAKKRGLNAVCQDAHRLNLGARRFDIIVFPESIGHMQMPVVFPIAYQYLHDGGKLIIITYPEFDVKGRMGYELRPARSILANLIQSSFRPDKIVVYEVYPRRCRKMEYNGNYLKEHTKKADFAVIFTAEKISASPIGALSHLSAVLHNYDIRELLFKNNTLLPKVLDISDIIQGFISSHIRIGPVDIFAIIAIIARTVNFFQERYSDDSGQQDEEDKGPYDDAGSPLSTAANRRHTSSLINSLPFVLLSGREKLGFIIWRDKRKEFKKNSRLLQLISDYWEIVLKKPASTIRKAPQARLKQFEKIYRRSPDNDLLVSYVIAEEKGVIEPAACYGYILKEGIAYSAGIYVTKKYRHTAGLGDATRHALFKHLKEKRIKKFIAGDTSVEGAVPIRKDADIQDFWESFIWTYADLFQEKGRVVRDEKDGKIQKVTVNLEDYAAPSASEEIRHGKAHRILKIKARIRTRQGKIEERDVEAHIGVGGNPKSKITLVMLPGFYLGRSGDWSSYIKYYEKFFRIITINLRGQGGSEVAAGTHNIYDLARDVKQVLDSLGVKENVILCGHSLGGAVVLAFHNLYAHHHPELIKGMFLATAPADLKLTFRNAPLDEIYQVVEQIIKLPALLDYILNYTPAGWLIWAAWGMFFKKPGKEFLKRSILAYLEFLSKEPEELHNQVHTFINKNGMPCLIREFVNVSKFKEDNKELKTSLFNLAVPLILGRKDKKAFELFFPRMFDALLMGVLYNLDALLELYIRTLNIKVPACVIAGIGDGLVLPEAIAKNVEKMRAVNKRKVLYLLLAGGHLAHLFSFGKARKGLEWVIQEAFNEKTWQECGVSSYRGYKQKWTRYDNNRKKHKNKADTGAAMKSAASPFTQLAPKVAPFNRACLAAYALANFPELKEAVSMQEPTPSLSDWSIFERKECVIEGAGACSPIAKEGAKKALVKAIDLIIKELSFPLTEAEIEDSMAEIRYLRKHNFEDLHSLASLVFRASCLAGFLPKNQGQIYVELLQMLRERVYNSKDVSSDFSAIYKQLGEYANRKEAELREIYLQEKRSELNEVIKGMLREFEEGNLEEALARAECLLSFAEKAKPEILDEGLRESLSNIRKLTADLHKKKRRVDELKKRVAEGRLKEALLRHHASFVKCADYLGITVGELNDLVVTYGLTGFVRELREEERRKKEEERQKREKDKQDFLRYLNEMIGYLRNPQPGMERGYVIYILGGLIEQTLSECGIDFNTALTEIGITPEEFAKLTEIDKACGLGIFLHGKMDEEAQEKTRQVIRIARQKGRIKQFKDLDRRNLGFLIEPRSEIVKLLREKEVYLILPEGDIRNRSPPYIWYESSGRFLVSATLFDLEPYRRAIYLPFGLIRD